MTDVLKTRKILPVAVVLGLAMGLLWFRVGTPSNMNNPAEAAFQVDPGILQTGDLVFRKGRSLASRIVLSADEKSDYSHVGILLMTDEEPLVIHASPDNDLARPVPLKIQPLSVYISRENASAISVRRHSEQRAAQKAAETAREYVRRSILFDPEFDLDSEERMYCTELVWRAFLASGIDLSEGIFDRITIPMFQGKYLLPGSILDHPRLSEVLTLTSH